jgi:hypothetical protein
VTQNRIPQPGERLRLPSGNVVELDKLNASSAEVAWICAYLRGGRRLPRRCLAGGEVTLREDWLRRFGAPLAGYVLAREVSA